MAENEEKTPKEKENKDDKIIYIGAKPLMTYATSVLTQFNALKRKEVVIKARGKAISKAVDVAEVVRNRFVPDAKIDSIQIGTDHLKNQEGGTTAVSTIEIMLVKG